MPRTLVVTCLAAALALAMLGVGQADVGARALAMGGAFVGLADDTSMTYYNPAALAFLSAPGFTLTTALNNRETVGFRDFVALVSPFDENSGVGISFARLNVARLTVEAISAYDPTEEVSLDWTEDWWWGSYGGRVAPRTAAGLNLRWVTADTRLTVDGQQVDFNADDAFQMDASLYHWVNDNLTVGLLIQNLTEPERDIEIGPEALGLVDLEFDAERVWRAGIGARLPDNNLILAADVTEADDLDFRLGVEKTIPGKLVVWAVRAGYNGDANALTAGIGARYEGWSLDFAFLGGDYDNTWYGTLTGCF